MKNHHKIVLFIVCFFCSLLPNVSTVQGRSFSKKEATSFSEIMMLYNNRICPINTFAKEFTLKISGKTSFHDMDYNQFLLAWIFDFDRMKSKPVIEVKSRSLRKKLQLKRHISLMSLFTKDNKYILSPLIYANDTTFSNKNKLRDEAIALDEKVQLIMMLYSGDILKIFPIREGGGGYEWVSPTSPLPQDMSRTDTVFIRKVLMLLHDSNIGSINQTEYFLSKIKKYQQKSAPEIVLPIHKIRAEILYNSLPYTTIIYRINLIFGLLGILYLFWVFYRSTRNRDEGFSPNRFIVIFYRIAVLFIFMFLTASIVLRMYISSYWALSNGYEMMLAISWCVLMITVVLCRKSFFVSIFGLIISGFTMLVVTLSGMNPQITHLMPVLSTPLLTLHISCIMIAYSLLLFSLVNSMLYFALLFVVTRKDSLVMLHRVSLAFVYPALFLLGVGIFIGAVWANISWGSYWSWDPKETWALITFIVYAIPIHKRTLLFFKHPTTYHLYIIIAFLTVLMTYFGVNYLLGGMHSYA